ncbi:MAG: hypothetical protein GDA54_00745 [Alphaproteobacteria bacterium GM7ARS4]|nr:hypothetical protein [Alphaproteobacteria bacterium GM7ARS4]
MSLFKDDESISIAHELNSLAHEFNPLDSLSVKKNILSRLRPYAMLLSVSYTTL